jgi:hypothetical protein
LIVAIWDLASSMTRSAPFLTKYSSKTRAYMEYDTLVTCHSQIDHSCPYILYS